MHDLEKYYIPEGQGTQGDTRIFLLINISQLDGEESIFVDAHIKKVYVPMTETGFYILLCLRRPNHGYGIAQMVRGMTDGEIILAPGAMYGSLSKMEKDGLIRFAAEEDKAMEVKKKFKLINIVQYEEEAAYLRQMHRSGWKLVRVTFPGNYCFEQCTPEDVVYQLDYNQEGIQHKAEYTQMFADCGWEYLFDFYGYSFFRKTAAEMLGEETIFCDGESHLAMLRRIFCGRLLPLLVMLFAVILPQLFRLSHDLASPVRMSAFVFFSGILGVYLAMFAWFGLCYLRMKNKAGK